MPEAIAAVPAVLAAGAGTAADVGAGVAAADVGAGVAAADVGAVTAADIAAAPIATGAALTPEAGAALAATVPAIDIAATPGLAAGLDAGAAAAGLSAADIGGSFASYAAAPLSDFAGAAGASLGQAGGFSPSSVAGAAPGAAPSGIPSSATALAPSTTAGAGGGGATSAASTAAPSSISALGANPDLTSFQVAGVNAPLSTDAGGAATAGGGALSSATTAPTTAAAPAAATPAASSSGGPLASLGSLEKQLGPIAALAGLGMNLMKGDQTPKFQPQVQAGAEQASAQSKLMESYLTSGTLPPALQTSLDAASDSAVTAIKSQYARSGMTGSSAEAESIQNARLQAQTQGAQIAVKLYDSGLQQAELSDAIYQSLMQTQLQQDQNLSNAVGNFAGAMAKMG